MKIIRILGRFVRSIIVGLLSLLIMFSMLVVIRGELFNQQDDPQRIAGKARYLKQLESLSRQVAQKPNIVFILYDDMGYGDIGAGAQDNGLIKTPHIDQLARQGVVLSDFYAPAPVCTPSRAGFLTGRLPPRAGLHEVSYPEGGAEFYTGVVYSTLIGEPLSNIRLPAEEITIAEVLGAAGYTTGMVGKWHLGDVSPSLPNDMGFQQFFGSLYSNDIVPFELYRDKSVEVVEPVDQRLLSETYTREAVAFIEENADEPFFLFFSHNFPHDPLAVRESRGGRSDAGLYGDVVEELDDGVGEIIATLESTGQLENTLIIISSDNGPWFLGNAGAHRGRKGNTFEGGMRVPFIAHWPAGIPGGRVENAMAMGTDLLPTLLEVLGLPLPEDRNLDGRSILNVLTRGGPSSHEYLFYYDSDELFAVRNQRFKYRAARHVLYSTDSWLFSIPTPQKEWLFDLESDRGESYDTATRHPEALQRLRDAYQAKLDEMKANTRGWK